MQLTLATLKTIDQIHYSDSSELLHLKAPQLRQDIEQLAK